MSIDRLSSVSPEEDPLADAEIAPAFEVENSSEQRLEQELMNAAYLLHKPRYFAADTGADPLTKGREIFLALSGVKPGALVRNTYPALRFRSRERIDNDTMAWLRDSFGFAALPQDGDREGTRFYIAKMEPDELKAEIDYIEGLKGPERAVAEGKFLGYPRTAINEFAYDNGDHCLSTQEQRRILAENGLPSKDLFFRFSEDSWKEELEEYKRWYAVLDEYGLGR